MLSYEKALQMKKSGYEFAIRYVGRLKQASFDIDKREVDNILRAGLKLAIVQHCPGDPGIIPSREMGMEYGKNAAIFSKDAGIRSGTSVYLDLENVKSGSKKPDIIDYCNAWYDEVVKNGYTPGIYIGYNTWLTGEELYHKLKFTHYWKSLSYVPDIPERGYEMVQKPECTVNGIWIDPDEVTGDKKGNFPVFMESETVKYYKTGLTHVFEFNPMALKAAATKGIGQQISNTYKNFVNSNFFSGSTIIGWLASEGKIISERRNDIKFGGRYDYPKGVFIVYKDGSVDVGLKTDKQMQAVRDKIWFCCQGFNLFPIDCAKEGFDVKEVGRTCTAVSLGYNGHVILAVRPLSNAQQSQATLKGFGCKCGIRLDSGSSANLYMDGKALCKTDSVLTNIIHW